MRTTQALTITLPHDMMQIVKDKVASGAYASDSEVVRDGLRALQARESAEEAWLREQVALSVAEMAARPDSAIPLQDVLASLKAGFRTASI
jgi:putative addiction module CopG family antidote